MISLPNAHVNAFFILDGKKYTVSNFDIGFVQATDFKGQPEHEVRGGLLTVTLSQLADNNLYLWAKKSTSIKNGQVVFQTDLGISILTIDFENAYCVSLTRDINALTGTKTILTISPEILRLNGIKHENYWKK